MKKLVTIAVFILSAVFAEAEGHITEIPLEQVQKALAKPVASHPRLFIDDQKLEEVMLKINACPELRAVHKEIVQNADHLIREKPLERIKKGRRLLDVSQEALKRLLNLGWAYRTTGEEKYLKRAEQEMLTITEFSDWNPKHFLDVAEMTTAFGIGYDWFYNGLSEQSRNTIRQAIMEKGIRPSLYEGRSPSFWVNTSNNWNQVCHGSLTCGVLAIMDEQPKLAETIIHRAVNKIQIAMNEYEPDGAYPEGPAYWVYGTTYNVLLLAALDSVIGQDFGLSEKTAFAKSASYHLHMTGPGGVYFNYSDCNPSKELIPALFWFAEKCNNPALTWNQQQLLKNAGMKYVHDLMSERMAVLTLIWATTKTAEPQALTWMGQGSNPVAMFRSSWQSNATFLAIKGGTARCNHSHMDVGSFVIDALGVRWAVDLGKEDYNKIESLGINLWGTSQTGDRWEIFRYTNFSHNTLTVNKQLQQVAGFAPIIRYSADAKFPHTVIDMTQVYKGQLEKALRGASLLQSGQILIQDELQSNDKPATVRWSMVTPAKVDIRSDKTATLTLQKKTMQFHVFTDADVKLATYSTEPRAKYDASNPDTRMIGFDIKLAANEKVVVRVVMTPGPKEKSFKLDIKNVENWSQSLK